MRIHGLTTCVNKADHLLASIGRWSSGLQSLTIVTDMEDRDCSLFLNPDVETRVHRTDAFYRDGAIFNKGRAMEEARLKMPWRDWILFLDCDVVPPLNWKALVEAAQPESGYLYGCWRYQVTDTELASGRIEDDGRARILGDGLGVGFFQLFHANDEGALRGWASNATDGFNFRVMTEARARLLAPLIETNWLHAGVYDCKFMDRWRTSQRERSFIRPIPGLRLAHLGPRDGWLGRGNVTGFEELMAERKRRGGSYEHERIAINGD